MGGIQKRSLRIGSRSESVSSGDRNGPLFQKATEGSKIGVRDVLKLEIHDESR